VICIILASISQILVSGATARDTYRMTHILTKRSLWSIPLTVVLTASGIFFEVWAGSGGPRFTVFAAVACIPAHVFAVHPLDVKFPVLSFLFTEWAVTLATQLLYALLLVSLGGPVVRRLKR
jgi:hypothetical protein